VSKVGQDCLKARTLLASRSQNSSARCACPATAAGAASPEPPTTARPVPASAFAFRALRKADSFVRQLIRAATPVLNRKVSMSSPTLRMSGAVAVAAGERETIPEDHGCGVGVKMSKSKRNVVTQTRWRRSTARTRARVLPSSAPYEEAVTDGQGRRSSQRYVNRVWRIWTELRSHYRDDWEPFP